ncbi:MAG TPA: hypothetical protein VEC75_08830, partial [Stellaceae bacterium]|nr:hypothetical protein [Stellaceae bacterium]
MLRLLLLLAAVVGISATAHASDIVQVENVPRSTECAEEDNVYVKFSRSGVVHFAIEALPPPYLATLQKDNSAPNFANCDMSHDVTYPFKRRDLLLYEDRNYRLMGHTYDRFWRPERVPFRVGGKVVSGLHLVQLLKRTDGHWIEVLVVYPADGYWRAKPLPPPQFADTSYGSSFLVGPIEEEDRPFVPIKSIEFVPSTVEFRLEFKSGKATLRLAEASRVRTRLEISFSPAVGTGPFAALRSMFVSPVQSDTAEAVIASPGFAPVTIPIPNLALAETGDITFARSIPSEHNTSA